MTEKIDPLQNDVFIKMMQLSEVGGQGFYSILKRFNPAKDEKWLSKQSKKMTELLDSIICDQFAQKDTAEKEERFMTLSQANGIIEGLQKEGKLRHVTHEEEVIGTLIGGVAGSDAPSWPAGTGYVSIETKQMQCMIEEVRCLRQALDATQALSKQVMGIAECVKNLGERVELLEDANECD